jgi:hypothetical protein
MVAIPALLCHSLFPGRPDPITEHVVGRTSKALHTTLSRTQVAIESYDLVSANDCPERDPLSWRLEGQAADPGAAAGDALGGGGSGQSRWVVLDERQGVLFGARHELRTFWLNPPQSPGAGKGAEPAPVRACYGRGMGGVVLQYHQGATRRANESKGALLGFVVLVMEVCLHACVCACVCETTIHEHLLCTSWSDLLQSRATACFVELPAKQHALPHCTAQAYGATAGACL